MLFEYEIIPAMAKAQKFAAALARNRADADDLFQDGVLYMLEKEHTRDPARGSVETWLCKFIYLKWLQRRSRRREVLLDDLPHLRALGRYI